MKKFIRNCMYILAIIILLSFILPSFSAKADTVTVSGKVTDKNGNVKGIKVILCDSNGNPYDNGKIYAETKEDGEYKISVPEGMGDYKLKFEYSGYKSAKAEQIGVKDYKQEQDVCEQLQVRYVIPRKEKDTFKNGKIARELNKCGNKSEYLDYPLEDYWITYDGNNKYNEKDDEIKDLNLIDIAKGVTTKNNTGLEPKIARIAIIIKVTKNMPGINEIKNQLKENVTDNGKYRYFVLDEENIFNDVKTEIEKEKEKEKKRTTICNNEDDLIEKVCNYIGFVITSTDIEIGNSNEDNLITNTISNGESTKVNLTLGDKKEETSTKPNEPTPSPEPSPEPDDPEPAPGPTDDPIPTPPSEPHLKEGDGDDITVKIFYKNIGDMQPSPRELSDYKVDVNLEKKCDKGVFKNSNNYTQQYGSNTCGLEYIEHDTGRRDEHDRIIYSTAGDYTITIKVGDILETTEKGFNGQNYDLEKVKIKKNGEYIDYDGFTTNREIINSQFAQVNKNNAQWVNPKGKLNSKTILEGTVKINNVPDVKAPFATPTKYEIEIVLTERPKFELKVEQKISAAQMILSNGQILKSYKAGDGTGSGMIGDKLLKWDVDDELKHGATVQVEYEITVRNTGAVDCTQFTLVDYLDYNNASLQYRKDANLITENEKNSKYNWEITDVNSIQSATSTQLDEGKTYLQIKDSLGAGDHRTYKLVASMVITSELAIDNYQNAVEIISYKNAIGRVDRSATPGTYNPSLDATETANPTDEADSAKAEEVLIAPPTGTKSKWYTQLLETILNMFI